MGKKADGQCAIGRGSKKAMIASAPVRGTAHVWHRRFFHLGSANLEKVARMVDSMPANELVAKPVAGAVCRPCAEGKMVRAPFLTSTTKTQLMELLHVDITDPFATSVRGSKHLITVLEDRTGILLGVPIRTKSDAGKVLRGKLPQLERKCGVKLMKIQLDGAKEFVTHAVLSRYDEKGIEVQTTPPFSSQNNGKAERINKNIKERVRAAVSGARAGDDPWAEAAVAAICVMNRSPEVGYDHNPWEEFMGEQPDVSRLVV